MTRPDYDDAIAMDRTDRMTLLELVAVVDEVAEDEAEVLATLRYMLDSGHVRVEDDSLVDAPWAA